jgi:HNH endonuclease
VKKPRWAVRFERGLWLWSEKEIDFLKNNLNGKRSVKWVVKQLGRSRSSVNFVTWRMKISQRFHYRASGDVSDLIGKKINHAILTGPAFKKKHKVRVYYTDDRFPGEKFSVDVGSVRSGTSTFVRGPLRRSVGSITKQGYRVIWIKGKKHLEHRVVMEKVLGRKLKKGETVHHGPLGRSCNDPENLSLRTSGRHPQGWSPREMKDYLMTVPKKLGGLA